MVDFQSRDTSRGIGEDEDDDEDGAEDAETELDEEQESATESTPSDAGDADAEAEGADAELEDADAELEDADAEVRDTDAEPERTAAEPDDRGAESGTAGADPQVEDPVEKARVATQRDRDEPESADPAGAADETAEASTDSTGDPLASGDAGTVDAESADGRTHGKEPDGASHGHDDHDHAGHSHGDHGHDDHDHAGHSHGDHDDHDHAGHSHGDHGDSHAGAEQVGVAVVTISSTRTREDDPSGDVVESTLTTAGHDVATRDVIRDDLDGIQSAVAALAERSDVDAVVTTGGTGVTPDDVTVEAVAPLFDKELPGFGELFRILSYEDVGTKALASRATAGIVDDCVVFCLPGSEAAARLGVEELVAAEVGHLVGLAQREE